jgi:hypothetical protein
VESDIVCTDTSGEVDAASGWLDFTVGINAAD